MKKKQAIQLRTERRLAPSHPALWRTHAPQRGPLPPTCGVKFIQHNKLVREGLAHHNRGHFLARQSPNGASGPACTWPGSPWKLAGSFLPAHTSIAKELCPLVHGSLDTVTWGLSMAESHPILSSSHHQTLHSVSTNEFRLYYSLVTYICSHFYIPTIHQVLYVYVCWLRLFTGVGILSSHVFLIYLLESCLGI